MDLTFGDGRILCFYFEHVFFLVREISLVNKEKIHFISQFELLNLRYEMRVISLDWV